MMARGPAPKQDSRDSTTCRKLRSVTKRSERLPPSRPARQRHSLAGRVLPPSPPLTLCPSPPPPPVSPAAAPPTPCRPPTDAPATTITATTKRTTATTTRLAVQYLPARPPALGPAAAAPYPGSCKARGSTAMACYTPRQATRTTPSGGTGAGAP